MSMGVLQKRRQEFVLCNIAQISITPNTQTYNKSLHAQVSQTTLNSKQKSLVLLRLTNWDFHYLNKVLNGSPAEPGSYHPDLSIYHSTEEQSSQVSDRADLLCVSVVTGWLWSSLRQVTVESAGSLLAGLFCVQCLYFLTPIPASLHINSQRPGGNMPAAPMERTLHFCQKEGVQTRAAPIHRCWQLHDLKKKMN